MSANLYVGTAGMSVWFSQDMGETWKRPYSESGLYLESRVWALSAHPDAPGQVFAGTDSGIYRWDEKPSKWTQLSSPMDDLCVWALEQAPHDPAVLIAGTHPAALYMSDDAGVTWRELDVGFAESCIYIGKPRVTKLLFDPDEPKRIWAGVEIDGVYRSEDGGVSWKRVSEGLVSEDIHGLAVVGAGNRRKLFAMTNKGLNVSRDDGDSWAFQKLDSEWQYGRAIQPRADRNGTIFLCNGNGPPGSTGRLLVSHDHGEHWEDAGLPGTLNSTPWCVATDPSDPNLVVVCTNLGQIFRSTDGGGAWTKLDRELGEIRSVLWRPA